MEVSRKLSEVKTESRNEKWSGQNHQKLTNSSALTASWPPEMAANSCLILPLQSSYFFLPSSPFIHQFTPSPASLITVYTRWHWQGVVLARDYNSLALHLGTNTDTFVYGYTQAHSLPNNNVWVCLCMSTTRSPFTVQLGFGFVKPPAVILNSWAALLANTDLFVSVCFLLSYFSFELPIMHGSQPWCRSKTLTKLSYYNKGNLPRSTVIS